MIRASSSVSLCSETPRVATDLLRPMSLIPWWLWCSTTLRTLWTSTTLTWRLYSDSLHLHPRYDTAVDQSFSNQNRCLMLVHCTESLMMIILYIILLTYLMTILHFRLSTCAVDSIIIGSICLLCVCAETAWMNISVCVVNAFVYTCRFAFPAINKPKTHKPRLLATTSRYRYALMGPTHLWVSKGFF